MCNNKNLIDRLDFIEFKQNIFFLKPPQHSAQLLYDLTFEDFLKIRDFTREYSAKIENGEVVSLNDFEKKLVTIWPQSKSYPLFATLVSRVLIEGNLYSRLTP